MLAAAASAAGIALAARDAHALRPDFDGERGFELDIAGGFNTFTNTSQRLFTRTSMVTAVPARNALLAGGHLAAHLGYRFLPFLSAGVTGQLVIPGAEPFVRVMETVPASALGGSVGVYVRFYYLGLITGTWRVRRVRMDRLADVRRLDPWLSVGFDFYQTLALTEQAPGSPYYARWQRTSVGVPVAVGLDVRPIAPLAIGIAATFNTWIGSGTHFERYFDDGSGIPRTETDQYDSADPVNLQVSIDLNIRYTLTL